MRATQAEKFHSGKRGIFLPERTRVRSLSEHQAATRRKGTTRAEECAWAHMRSDRRYDKGGKGEATVEHAKPSKGVFPSTGGAPTRKINEGQGKVVRGRKESTLLRKLGVSEEKRKAAVWPGSMPQRVHEGLQGPAMLARKKEKRTEQSNVSRASAGEPSASLSQRALISREVRNTRKRGKGEKKKGAARAKSLREIGLVSGYAEKNDLHARGKRRGLVLIHLRRGKKEKGGEEK